MQLAIDAPSIFIYTQPVDFRKSIDGLLDVVVSELSADPRMAIFIFYNRTRDKAKILSWHKNGFVLLLRRLEKGRFYPVEDERLVKMTSQQLSWLLAGLDWVSMTEWGELEYRDFH